VSISSWKTAKRER